MKPKQSLRLLRVFFLFGVVMFCRGVWLAVQSARAYAWPVVEGVISTRKIVSHVGGEDGGTVYSPKISYEYSVAGSHWTGETIALGMMSGSSFDDSNDYPLGKKVLIHYNPANPSQAVLEPGIHGGTLSFLALGGMFALLAGYNLKRYNYSSDSRTRVRRFSPVIKGPEPGSIAFTR